MSLASWWNGCACRPRNLSISLWSYATLGYKTMTFGLQMAPREPKVDSIFSDDFHVKWFVHGPYPYRFLDNIQVHTHFQHSTDTKITIRAIQLPTLPIAQHSQCRIYRQSRGLGGTCSTTWHRSSPSGSRPSHVKVLPMWSGPWRNFNSNSPLAFGKRDEYNGRYWEWIDVENISLIPLRFDQAEPVDWSADIHVECIELSWQQDFVQMYPPFSTRRVAYLGCPLNCQQWWLVNAGGAKWKCNPHDVPFNWFRDWFKPNDPHVIVCSLSYAIHHSQPVWLLYMPCVLSLGGL